ncbi:hypothetical protein ES288_A13G073600v1 [Gossypium darwinii]|uniref:Dynamin-type G domain-containing protein n=1 Tax=Gossypium darwinii TaxID=34276 RepID=A0A5D2DXM2_GOSDA|nr:hypothetical protein ES288_A13G073600v1 [Gossypium darwinii]
MIARHGDILFSYSKPPLSPFPFSFPFPYPFPLPLPFPVLKPTIASKPWQWPSERSCRFPKIVAFGSQSDGKSSLLEALLGFRFNVREIEMGTRRPLILQMVHYRSALEPRCRFQVLTETDHCYCVLVNALDGEAFPSEKDTNDSSSSNKVPLRVDTNSMKTKNTIKWSGMHMMALSFLSLAATCSTASVTSLLVNVSSTYCPSKICSRYQLSAAMTFMLRLLSFVLILFNLWLLLSL